MVWPAIIAAGATIGAGLLQNKQASDMASDNRSFQERLSSTAHQRQVADLRKAGLNPILSANKGASTPSGSMARPADIAGATANSAIAATRLKQELRNLRANEDEAYARAQAAESSSLLNDALMMESFARQTGIHDTNRILRWDADYLDTPLGEISRMGEKGGQLIGSGAALTRGIGHLMKNSKGWKNPFQKNDGARFPRRR